LAPKNLGAKSLV